jgi:hypothetical protein
MNSADAHAALMDAIAKLAARAGGARSSGVSETLLSEWEQQGGRKIPAPVRTLLLRVGPSDWERAVKDVRLCGTDELQWVSDEGLGDCIVFACGCYGDAVFCDESGRVLLADHESDEGVVVLESSLSAWLARLAAYDGVEYAYFMGALPSQPVETQRHFMTRHRELNPNSEWAARGLLRLDFPKGHPMGYHHWDRATKRLVPITKAGDVTRVTLEKGTQRDLESVVEAGRCEHLMIVGGTIEDLSPLSRLRSLRELYVYNFLEIDLSALTGLSELVDACFLRCRLRGLEVLAGAPKLARLRLNDCQFDEDALQAVRAGRPGIGISR